jgi:hypothetical protein
MGTTTYAVFKQCSLVKSDGIQCGSPAITGGNFCWHHMGGKTPRETSQPRRHNSPLKLLYPSDHVAIQHNIFLVMQALSDEKIDTDTALAYTRMLRFADLNLRRWQALRNQAAEEQTMPQPQQTPQPAEMHPSPDEAHPEAHPETHPDEAHLADTEPGAILAEAPGPASDDATAESGYATAETDRSEKRRAESLQFLKARLCLLKARSAPEDQKEIAFLTSFFAPSLALRSSIIDKVTYGDDTGTSGSIAGVEQ